MAKHVTIFSGVAPHDKLSRLFPHWSTTVTLRLKLTLGKEMVARLIGSSLSDEQQSRIKSEIYGENEGDMLTIEALMSGLDHAADLLTQEVVSYEKSHAAYEEKC